MSLLTLYQLDLQASGTTNTYVGSVALTLGVQATTSGPLNVSVDLFFGQMVFGAQLAGHVLINE